MLKHGKTGLMFAVCDVRVKQTKKKETICIDIFTF